MKYETCTKSHRFHIRTHSAVLCIAIYTLAQNEPNIKPNFACQRLGNVDYGDFH